MVIANTPGVKSRHARPRVSTSKRGGDLDPDGDQRPVKTGRERGQYPKSNGGPPTPDFPSKSGPSGSAYEIKQINRQVPPIATRKTPRVKRSEKNPIK